MIRDALSLEEIGRWDFTLAVLVVMLWVMWAFMTWDDVGAWQRSRDAQRTTNCPFCRQMHKAGECKRDQGGEQDEPEG